MCLSRVRKKMAKTVIRTHLLEFLKARLSLKGFLWRKGFIIDSLSTEPKICLFTRDDSNQALGPIHFRAFQTNILFLSGFIPALVVTVEL